MWAAPPGYELVEELGQGAMGTVYLARQPALGLQVALKRIAGGASSQDPETVRRFEREARLLTGLHHPAIVRVHQLVRDGPDLVVVMDHVAGTDLSRVLEAGPPVLEQAARYVSRIAAALDHAHGAGVLHRDLKPSNVLIGEDGEARVADFGLAALLERQARLASRPGAAPATPAYMAPELARGDLTVDSRADVYSLGVIAYEMLVGRVPFPVDPADVYATVRAQMERPPPPPSGLVPGFPPLLDAVLLWALQKQPERRPATAGELAVALQDALRRSPGLPAPMAGLAGSGGSPAEPNGRPPRRSGGARRWAWLPRALAVTAAVAAAGILAGGALGLAASAALAPAPLRVTSVRIVSAPPACPTTAVRLTGAIDSDGAGGSIAYRWLRPDGRLAPEQRVTVPAGQRSTTVTLTIDLAAGGAAGGGTTPGVAALHVVSPASVYSQPVPVPAAC